MLFCELSTVGRGLFPTFSKQVFFSLPLTSQVCQLCVVLELKWSVFFFYQFDKWWFRYQERHARIPLIASVPKHLCVCPQLFRTITLPSMDDSLMNRSECHIPTGLFGLVQRQNRIYIPIVYYCCHFCYLRFELAKGVVCAVIVGYIVNHYHLAFYFSKFDKWQTNFIT